MSLGFWEIVLIVVVVLVLFGPKRIPELARAIGRANYEYKKAKNDIEAESKELIENSEKAAEAQDKKSETQA
ncbi:MAG: twin-arginine translocase TatA/TatE family subunit [Candidatus Riflebacteria bacterium]|jgi:sec-independent protein translocase protein TatA|nr:twin-arginine translocase TatA/TatE family subunit [Candidatus Riflebacteria bacterium]